MSGIFVFSDTQELAAELVTYARNFDNHVVLIMIGEVDARYLNLGASQVICLMSSEEVVESYALPLAQLLTESQARALLVGDTVRGHDLAARVAGLCRAGMISGASSVEVTPNGWTATRSIYGGKLIETRHVEGMAIITMGTGVAAAMVCTSESPVEKKPVTADHRVSLVARETVDSGHIDLSTAPVVVGIGLGVAEKEDLVLMERLANCCGGGVSCSRGVCEERGWFGQYIGISGLNLSPNLYLAIGVSGQIQHMYGVREAKIIAAINTNKDAPIFRGADYGIVGDYRKVLPLLIDSLS